MRSEPGHDGGNAAGRLGRAAAWLAPAGRRDWVRAIWAEAGEAPPGLRRLTWLAGAVYVTAREALVIRRTGSFLLFAAAAAAAVRACWPGSPAGFATVVARIDVVTAVLLLAGLVPARRRVRRCPGPDRGQGRVSRIAPAPAAGTPAREFDWFTQIVFLVVIAGYVAGILAVTARRSRIAPATLAIGTGMGIALGVVMYAVAPLGLSKYATEPWLAGSAIDPVVALAWILLLGAPLLGGAVAGLRYRGQGSPEQPARATIAQGGAAGFLATGVGAVMVAVLGTGTIALLRQAAWIQHWLYPGQHLDPAVAYRHELAASSSVGGYGLILLAFPVIGLLLGLYSSAVVPVGAPGRAADGSTAREEADPALP